VQQTVKETAGCVPRAVSGSATTVPPSSSQPRNRLVAGTRLRLLTGTAVARCASPGAHAGARLTMTAAAMGVVFDQALEQAAELVALGG